MIDREALVSKALSTNLHPVVSQVIQVVNSIKSWPLQSRLFSKLCKAMGSLAFQRKVLKRLCQVKH